MEFFYIDYMNGNKKERNIGFVRVEREKISIGLRGVPVQAGKECEVIAEFGDKKVGLGRIFIKNGYGAAQFEWLKEYPGSFNSLAESVNKINSILRKLIRTVKTASGEVGNGAEQLADATNLLSQGTVTQANSLSTVVIEIDNITAAISQSSENGEMINERLQHLDKEIHEGNSQMSELLSAVQQANEMTTDIKKIVSNIDSIAFQTNILALNASVEAAHAGQMGRGFAVVAEEVRDLATKCAEASGETKELIEQCVRAIDKARNSAEITSSSLNSINENSTNISNAFVEISNATSSQAKKTKDIQNEINNISDVVQSNTATSQEIAASTTELSEQANNLKKMINKFVL